IVVLGCVVGGFVLEGGHLLALWHPTEILIIVGAALGAFMTSNPPKIVKAAFKGAIMLPKGPRYKREDYVTLLKLVYDILIKIRKEGVMAIENDLEHPDKSPLFQKYPVILADHHMEAHAPAHAVQKVADALPGFGIVAAVLGIVNTMSALEGADTATIGHKVGAALVGTFLGILVSYGLVGPIATAMEHRAGEEGKAFEVVKMALVASVRGYAPPVAVEFARKLLFSEVRPTFADLEAHLKGKAPREAKAA